MFHTARRELLIIRLFLRLVPVFYRGLRRANSSSASVGAAPIPTPPIPAKPGDGVHIPPPVIDHATNYYVTFDSTEEYQYVQKLFVQWMGGETTMHTMQPEHLNLMFRAFVDNIRHGSALRQ